MHIGAQGRKKYFMTEYHEPELLHCKWASLFAPKSEISSAANFTPSMANLHELGKFSETHLGPGARAALLGHGLGPRSTWS